MVNRHHFFQYYISKISHIEYSAEIFVLTSYENLMLKFCPLTVGLFVLYSIK